MNWRSTYARLQITFTVYLTSAFGAGCWSFLISGLLNIVFDIGDNESLVYIGAPLFIIFFPILTKKLPEPLRKAGLLSDPPDSFESPNNRDNV